MKEFDLTPYLKNGKKNDDVPASITINGEEVDVMTLVRFPHAWQKTILRLLASHNPLTDILNFEKILIAHEAYRSRNS